MKIPVKEILLKYRIDYEEASENFKVFCPYHDDNTTISAKIHNETGIFYCWTCTKSANFYNYLSKKVGINSNKLYYEVNLLIGQEKEKLFIPPEKIEKFHVNLYEPYNERLLKELYKRCINDEIIAKYRIGEQAGRVSIPITNAVGQYVDLFLYLPGAHKDKFLRHSKKNFKVRLYPIDQLEYDKILVCGGMLKATAAAHVLNPFGIGAISPTCSENSWDSDITGLFHHKTLYVNCDVDEVGRTWSQKRCVFLSEVAREIYKVDLPLDIKQFPKGDINDYLRETINSKEALYNLLEMTPIWLYVPPDTPKEVKPVQDSSLVQEIQTEVIGEPKRFAAVVASIHTSSYHVPKDIHVLCSREEKCCTFCPLKSKYQTVEQQHESIPSDSLAIISMIDCNLEGQEKIIKKALKIPKSCKSFIPKTESFHKIEDTKISPEFDLRSRTDTKTMQTAYFVGEQQVELNVPYKIECIKYPHPQTQEACFVVTKYEATEDNLDSYSNTVDTEALKIFSPEKWTVSSIQDKLNSIYEDFEANVTQVYQRRNAHLAIDLFYHSPLFLKFEGKTDLKGWVEILLIGDSGNAKSKLCESICNHYKAGVIHPCENSTRPGIVGGLDGNKGERKFVTWGIIPRNDRRGVILDEISEMPEDILPKMTSMRSRGIAEFNMVGGTRQALARTRLFWTSNARYGRAMNSFPYGVEAVPPLMKALQAIRRFDMVIGMAHAEIDQTKFPKKGELVIDHVYNTDLCNQLILFAWTVDNVVFEDEDYVVEVANGLAKKYSDEIPIVDKGSIREKIARLSAALAVRTFSTVGEGSILVRRCHTEYIAKYLNEVYDAVSLAYNEYSKKKIESSTLRNPEELKATILDAPRAKQFVEVCLTQESLDSFLIQDIMGGWSIETTRKFMSELIMHRAISKNGRGYKKTSAFNLFLRQLSSELDTEVKRPSYLPPIINTGTGGDNSEF